MTGHYNDNDDDCRHSTLHVCNDKSIILKRRHVGIPVATTTRSKRKNSNKNRNKDKKQNRKNAKLLRSMDMSNSRELFRLKQYLDTQVTMPYQLEIRGCQHQTITITTTTTTTTTADAATASSSCRCSTTSHDARKEKMTASNHQIQQRQVFAFTNVTTPAIIGVLRNHHASRRRHEQQDEAVATTIILLQLYHDQLLQVLYGGDHDQDNDKANVNNHYWLQSSNVETLIIANSYCSMATMSSLMSSMSTTRQEQLMHQNNNNNHQCTHVGATFQRLTHLTLTSCHWPDSLYQDLIRSCSGTLQHFSCHLLAGGPKSIHNLLLGGHDSRHCRHYDDHDDVQQLQRQPWTSKEEQVDTRSCPSTTTLPENKDWSTNTQFHPHCYLPRLESLDLRGSLTCNQNDDKVASTTTETTPRLTFLAPNLTTVVLIPTWQSQHMYLKHVLTQLFGVDVYNHDDSNCHEIGGIPESMHDSLLENCKLQTVILGKMTATSDDMEALGACLKREQCSIRRLHLLSLDFEHEDVTTMKNDHHGNKEKNWQDSFLQLVRHNRSLMEISLHTGEATRTAETNVESRCPSRSRTVDSKVTMIDSDNHVQKELQSLVMRNIYLTRGLGRLVDVRLLPQYIYHHVNMAATTVDQSCGNGPSTRDTTMMTNQSPVDVIYFMVRQRPDLFCSKSHCVVD